MRCVGYVCGFNPSKGLPHTSSVAAPLTFGPVATGQIWSDGTEDRKSKAELWRNHGAGWLRKRTYRNTRGAGWTGPRANSNQPLVEKGKSELEEKTIPDFQTLQHRSEGSRTSRRRHLLVWIQLKHHLLSSKMEATARDTVLPEINPPSPVGTAEGEAQFCAPVFKGEGGRTAGGWKVGR